MKAILEFELPEDKDAFTLASHGLDWYCAVHDFDQWLRREVKDGKEPDAGDIRDRLYLELDSHGVSFEDVS